MPYSRRSELPKPVRDALPASGQDIWMSAYAAAEKKWPGEENEGRRASYAWGAVKQAGFKRDAKTGKWSKPASESSAPAGSHEELREKLREAVENAKLFPVTLKSYWYIQYVYDDVVVVDYYDGTGNTLWQIPYTADADGKFTFGQMVKVEIQAEIVPAEESAARPLHAFGLRLTPTGKAATEAGGGEPELTRLHVVEDARHNPDKGDYHIVVFAAGVNEGKRRVYLNETVEKADLKLYDGRKMYLDHDVPDGSTGGVRSVRDLAATTHSPWVVPASESGAGTAELHAIAHVFPDVPGFSANMKDAEYRKNVFTSHVFGYRGHYAKEQTSGKVYEVIKEITAVDSVDWVTEPGARGRIAEHNEGNDMDITKLTADELRTARPDLVQEIADGAVAAHRVRESDAADETKTQADLKAANERATQAETRLRTIEIEGAVGTAVAAKDSGIPDAVRTEVAGEIAGQVSGMPSTETEGGKLKTVVESAVKTKAEQFKKATGKPDPSVTTSQRTDGSDDSPAAKAARGTRGYFRV